MDPDLGLPRTLRCRQTQGYPESCAEEPSETSVDHAAVSFDHANTLVVGPDGSIAPDRPPYRSLGPSRVPIPALVQPGRDREMGLKKLYQYNLIERSRIVMILL